MGRRVLLTACQHEFESLPCSLGPTPEAAVKMSTDEANEEISRRKKRLLANMRFIGHLFLRELLAVKVMASVVYDLIGTKESASAPEEHKIECACALLSTIGYTFDQRVDGQLLMTQFLSRMNDLKSVQDGTKRGLYSKRVQFLIQDVQEMRDNGWVTKVLKEKATTKAEVRREAQQEAHSKLGRVGFAQQTAGMKPRYIQRLKESLV